MSLLIKRINKLLLSKELLVVAGYTQSSVCVGVVSPTPPHSPCELGSGPVRPATAAAAAAAAVIT